MMVPKGFLGCLVVAVAAAGMAGCGGGGGNGKDGGIVKDAGNGTTPLPDSGTVPTCSSAGGSCTANTDCCQTGGTLVCTAHVCAAPQVVADGGSECNKLTDPCSHDSDCCAPLVCDQSGGPTSGECIEPAPDAGGTLGASCVTLANCAAGFVCNAEPDGGETCGPPAATATLQCVQNGGACGTGKPQCCGGTCGADNKCHAWTACATETQACSTTADCCGGLACADGGCASICGEYGSSCTQDSDCCLGQGLACLSTGNGQSACAFGQIVPRASDGGYEMLPDGNFNFITCSEPGDPNYDPNYQCQLGMPCQPVTQQGQTDECAAAGLVCSSNGSVCRLPEEFEFCYPGGPSCAPLPNSDVQLQCIGLPFQLPNPNMCVQPCNTTADCVDPQATCVGMQGVTGKFCFFDVQHQNGCTNYYGPCPMETGDDGLCFPFVFGEGTSQPQTYGICQQTMPDAGPGTPCLSGGLSLASFFGGGNRQQGGLCDAKDVCDTSFSSIEGLCQPLCDPGQPPGNTGSIHVPTCGDAGTCIAIVGETKDNYDTGVCGVACDFTAQSSGCPAGAKCDPDLLLMGNDDPSGLCVPTAPHPVSLGGECDPYAAQDPCAAGSFCLSDTNGRNVCTAVCLLSGPSTCPAGTVCAGINTGNGVSVRSGACQPGDGGTPVVVDAGSLADSGSYVAADAGTDAGVDAGGDAGGDAG